jgi:hypothetical protein
MKPDESKTKDWKVVRQDTHGTKFGCDGIRCGDETLRTLFLTATEAETMAARLMRQYNRDGGHKQDFLAVRMDTPCL